MDQTIDQSLCIPFLWYQGIWDIRQAQTQRARKDL